MSTMENYVSFLIFTLKKIINYVPKTIEKIVFYQRLSLRN